jgi:hypothetical protein
MDEVNILEVSQDSILVEFNMKFFTEKKKKNWPTKAYISKRTYYRKMSYPVKMWIEKTRLEGFVIKGRLYEFLKPPRELGSGELTIREIFNLDKSQRKKYIKDMTSGEQIQYYRALLLGDYQ